VHWHHRGVTSNLDQDEADSGDDRDHEAYLDQRGSPASRANPIRLGPPSAKPSPARQELAGRGRGHVGSVPARSVQPNVLTSNPPEVGPTVTRTPPTANHTPTDQAGAPSSSPQVWLSKASEHGTRRAAPKPPLTPSKMTRSSALLAAYLSNTKLPLSVPVTRHPASR
jgi:hypothetical protein